MVVTGFEPVMNALFDFAVLLALLMGVYALHLMRKP